MNNFIVFTFLTVKFALRLARYIFRGVVLFVIDQLIFFFDNTINIEMFLFRIGK